MSDHQVGDIVSTKWQYAALPVGSKVMREQAASPLTKKKAGWRCGNLSRAYSDFSLSGVKMRVVRVGPKPKKLKIALWLLAESEWKREDVSAQSITSRKASDIDLTSRLRLAAELRSTQITDDDLSMTFGPQWEAIVALVRRCAALTESEAVALDAAWDARAAARDAAWAAARGTAWDAAWDAAWAAARDAARDAARPATRPAVRAAMCALVVRDLITDDGFTQAHYDLLTGPWSEVIGKVHPDDTTTVTLALDLAKTHTSE